MTFCAVRIDVMYGIFLNMFTSETYEHSKYRIDVLPKKRQSKMIQQNYNIKVRKCYEWGGEGIFDT